MPTLYDVKRPVFVGSKLQAVTEFKSPYWGLSYNFPYNPDPLCSNNNYDIYDEMIDDDQVKSAIAIKKDMVVNTGWKIEGESEEVNEFVTECLRHINEGIGLDSSFDDVLRDILSAYEYGFSMTEPIYTIENGKYKYKAIRTRAPHSFKFILDNKGTVTEVIQSISNGDLHLNPNIFIHHVYQMQFGNPYGKSDLRAAYNAWKAKKFFTRFFAIYVERFASGIVVGKYPKNLPPDEVERYHTILKSIQHASIISIPEEFMLEFVQTERDSSQVYIRGLDYYNMQIARSILVPDLLGIGGTETKGGSYALGKEQFKIFLSTIKKDRKSLERKITMKLIRPLVQANFGNVKCEFKFIPYSHGDIESYLKIWVEAVKAGVYSPSDEEINHFRTSLGFPEGKMKSVPQVEKKTYIYRQLTTYEKKVDFNSIKETLDNEESRISFVLKIETSNIINDLINQIINKGLLKKFKPEKINEIQPKNLKSLNTIFRNYFIDIFQKSYSEVQKELFPENKIKKLELDLLPDEFLDLLKVEAFKIVGDYSVLISKQAKNMIIQAIKDGISESETVKIISNSLKNTTETWMETVVRTKTTEIYNEARKRYWETDKLAKQIVEAYQWSSILDDRTSAICRHLDGKIFKVGELSNRIKPPAHFNCFVPGTKITMRNKNLRETSEKRKKIENVKVGDYVYTHKGNWKEVTYLHKNWFNGQLIELELENKKKIKCTPNHPILTERGWIEANKLEITDNIITLDNVKAIKQWKDNIIRRRKQSEWFKTHYKPRQKTGNYIFCKYCGKSIYQQPSRLRKGKQVYCNRKCFEKSGAMNNPLEKNPAWQGGIAYEPYGLKFNKELKLKIKKRDKFRCCECGAPESESRLHIHHIDYNRKNNKLNNLITLCVKCRSKTLWNRKNWMKYFQGVLNENKKYQEIKL